MTGVQSPIALVGRILIAAVFLWQGYAKLIDFTATVGYARAAGMPLPEVGVAIGAVIELLGSALLIFGFQIRVVALIMAGFSIATALIFHRDLKNFDEAIHFWKDLCIAGGLLQIVAFGGGGYSIDARRG